MSTEALGGMDALLSMAFEEYVTNAATQSEENGVDANEEESNCYELYEK